MKKLLIIDDDLDCVILLKKCFERKGYDARYMLARAELPDLVTTFAPDVLIIDILQLNLLNNKSIYELFRSTKIILLSGRLYTQINTDINFDGIIRKPFELTELESKIAELVQ